MLEQTDFINAEKHYSAILKNLKLQLENNEISMKTARYNARIQLSNLKFKLPLCRVVLAEEEYQKIENLVTKYENFISSLKIQEFTL